MSKECFNCKKQIPIEEYSKHELECNSKFCENEMDNLIPCEKCDTLIPFEDYNNHISLCGIQAPIFYFPIPNVITDNSNINTNGNPNEDTDDNTEEQNSPESLLENINMLIQNNTNIINYLNSINPEVDTYEQLSQLDENKVNQGISLDKISKSEEKEIDCPICFEKCSKINILNCKHEICSECSEEWFQENVKCPICATDFTEN